MSATKQPAAGPPDERPVLARDDVHVATNRCPYCHDDVAATAADVCRDCLARHHSTCWREVGARCAACGSTHVLRGPRPPITHALLRELLEREGYEADDVARFFGAHDPGLCPLPGCTSPGVARGNFSQRLHCASHARGMRAQGVVLFVILLVIGLVVGGVGFALIADGKESAVFFAIVGAPLVVLSSWGLVALWRLPPVPPEAPR